MNHRPSLVLAVCVAMALAVHANPYLRGSGAPPSMPFQEQEQDLEAVKPMAASAPPPPPARSMPSLRANLPPSALSVSYYDSTEYEVSPLRMPLSLPHPPPPPSFDSAAATQQANMLLETGARFGAQPPAQQFPQQQQQMMYMQQPQQQMAQYPVQPMMLQQAQHMGPMPPQGNAPFLPNPPAAPTLSQFFPQQQQMMPQQQQQQFYAPQPMFVQQQQRMYVPMRAPPSRRHMKLKHRLQRRGGHRAHMVKGGVVSPRTVRRARMQRYVPQPRPAVHYGAPGPVTMSLLQTQSQMHAHTSGLQSAGTPTYYKPGQTVPWLTRTPASVTTRGAVPHFQATVRSLPGQSPYANNNPQGVSFMEQSSQAYATRDAYGRPVEPTLPRLPQPPVADVVVQ